MRKSGSPTAQVRVKPTRTRTLAREIEPLWISFLRRRHPFNTAKEVAREIGWSPATVKKWLNGETEPSFRGTLALIWAYGPDFLSEVHPAPLHWLKPVQQAEEIAVLRREQAAIQARLDALA